MGRRDEGDTETNWIGRIRISGATPLWRELSEDDDQNHLRDELTYRLGLLDLTLELGSIYPVVRPDEHRAREDVLGQTLRLVEDVRSGGARLTDLSPEQLIGLDEPERLSEYVKELLDDGDAEILARSAGAWRRVHEGSSVFRPGLSDGSKIRLGTGPDGDLNVVVGPTSREKRRSSTFCTRSSSASTPPRRTSTPIPPGVAATSTWKRRYGSTTGKNGQSKGNWPGLPQRG